MIIVVTGTVGLDKKNYLEQVCKLARKKNKDIQLFNVGNMMYAEAPDITPGRILDIPLKRLHSLRRSVFKDIIAKSRKAKNVIVNTHATFRWKHGLFPAVDFDQMRLLNADVYICLIDGVTAVHTRLNNEHESEHTLKDLIVWREEEILGTEMLCKGINEKTPCYCLTRGSEKETSDTFYKLIFEPSLKKVYLSFPMTAVVDMADVKQKIDRFRTDMKTHFVCFDPADLEEAYLPAYVKKAVEQGRVYAELNCLGQTIKLDTGQIQQIERDIYSQTYARDFMMIDQADMIISCIPEMDNGRAAISSGVERELQHAHEAAKEVYVIWPAKQSPSVFVTQTATKIFAGTDEAVAFFKKKGYIESENA